MKTLTTKSFPSSPRALAALRVMLAQSAARVFAPDREDQKN